MKQYLFGSLLLVPGLALAQTPAAAPQTFTLKGTIGRLNAPAKVYLLREGHQPDSAALKNGVFELKGTVDAPKQAWLILQRQGQLKKAFSQPAERLTVFLEPGPVVLTSPDSLPKAKVTGGPLTRDYNQLKAALQPTEDKLAALNAAYERTPEAQREEFERRNKAQGEALNQERQRIHAEFIKAHPASWVSLNALQQLSFNPEYAVVAPLYEVLSPALKNSAPGKAYAERLARLKAVAIGAQAPNFSQQTPDGKTVSLADFRGKYVLVDFWASWCHPCREENPNVLRAYNEFKGRNFEVLGVSLDDAKGREKWLKAIKDDGMPWVQVSDLKGWQNEAARSYDVQGIPQNFLIDPQGKILAANLRGDELKAALARYIK